VTKYWKDKKVVVTGGAGFVGTHLSKKLFELGASIEVLDLNVGRSVLPGVKYHIMDARNFKDCLHVMDGAFAVFNLAAKVAGVEYNQNNSFGMMMENVPLQTVPVMAALKAEVPHFVQISSVCVYPDNKTSPCDDGLMVDEMEAPNKANYGYAWAKRLGELAVMEAGLPHWIIARPTNIYGPGDDFGPRGHVIPALIKKAYSDKVINVNGTGDEVREFVYVEDVVGALIHLAEYGDSGVYNIGTGGRTKATIANLVKLIQAASSTENKAVVFESKFNPGDNIRYTNSGKLESQGFVASTTLSEGIASTIRWWRGQR